MPNKSLFQIIASKKQSQKCTLRKIEALKNKFDKLGFYIRSAYNDESNEIIMDGYTKVKLQENFQTIIVIYVSANKTGAFQSKFYKNGIQYVVTRRQKIYQIQKFLNLISKAQKYFQIHPNKGTLSAFSNFQLPSNNNTMDTLFQKIKDITSYISYNIYHIMLLSGQIKQSFFEKLKQNNIEAYSFRSHKWVQKLIQ